MPIALQTGEQVPTAANMNHDLDVLKVHMCCTKSSHVCVVLCMQQEDIYHVIPQDDSFEVSQYPPIVKIFSEWKC